MKKILLSISFLVSFARIIAGMKEKQQSSAVI